MFSSPRCDDTPMPRTLPIIGLLLVGSSLAPADELAPPPREVRVDRYGDPLPEGAMARLGTTRFRHVGARSLSFTSDGSRFVTWHSYYRTIHVWDAATGNRVHVWSLPEVDNYFNCISSDGRIVAVENDSNLEIWRIDEKRLLRKLALRDASSFSAVAISPDGKKVVTADNTPREHRLRLWDLETGKDKVFGATEDHVDDLVWNANGRQVFSRTSQANCVAWDPDKPRENWHHKGLCQSIHPNADGTRLMVHFSDKIDVLSPVTGDSLLEQPIECPARVACVAFSADGNRIAVSDGKQIQVYETADRKVVRRIDGRFTLMAFSPDGKYLQVVEDGCLVQSIELKTGNRRYPINQTPSHDSSVREIAWSPDGRRIAAVGSCVQLWNADNGEPLRRFQVADNYVLFICFLDGSKHLLGCTEKHIFDWDTEANKEVNRWELATDSSAEDYFVDPRKIKRLPYAQRIQTLLLSSNVEKPIEFVTFDFGTGKWENRHRLDIKSNEGLEKRWVNVSDFYIVGAGRVFHAPSRTEAPPLVPPPRQDERFASRFSPDGRLILTQVYELFHSAFHHHELLTEKMVVSERATGNCIFEFRGRGEVAFSPSNRQLAITHDLGLKIWDLALGNPIVSRVTSEASNPLLPPFSSLAFSPDGKRLATGHHDTTVLIWDNTPPPKPKPEPLATTDLESLWSDLAGLDAARGMEAVWKLQDRPEQALSLLKERLRPATAPDVVKFKKLIENLDGDGFREREWAMRALAGLGDSAKPGLEAALRSKLTAEQEKRVRDLLAELDSRKPPRGDDLRGIRALAVLEYIQTEESRKLIASLAAGLEGARLTREAKETLERLPRSER